jgi:methylenetetrahydrofolate reductase (NADPH)
MTFAERLARGEFPVALEITPPLQSRPAILHRRATLLGDAASAVNVIQRPGRQPSLEAACELLAGGLEPVWHLVNRGSTRAGVAADVATARDAGIRNVLCIRGDHDAPDTADTPTIREVVATVRDHLPGALIGATLNQYTPDRAAALKNLWPKLAEGATYVQTQPVFELATLAPLAAEVRARVPGTRIVAMAMPIPDSATLQRVSARLGIEPPAGLAARLASGPAAAWQAFAEVLSTLRASPLIDGVAIMTFEMDPPPGTGIEIVRALRAAGIT